MFLFIHSTESVNYFCRKRQRLIIAICWNSNRKVKKWPHLASWDIPSLCPFLPHSQNGHNAFFEESEKGKVLSLWRKKTPDPKLRVAGRLALEGHNLFVSSNRRKAGIRHFQSCKPGFLCWARPLIELQSSGFLCLDAYVHIMVIKILIQNSLNSVKGAWLSFESKLQATGEWQILTPLPLLFPMFMKTRMVWLTCYWKRWCYLSAFPDLFDSDAVWQRAYLQFLKCKFITYEQLCSEVFLSSSMCNFI